MDRNKLLWIGLFVLIIVLVSCSNAASTENNEEQEKTDNSEPPSVSELDPDDNLTPFIEWGEALLDGSEEFSTGDTASKLNCMSCHADGADTDGVSFVGITSEYPTYEEREGSVITLEEKINHSITRTLNGEKIEYDGEEMRSIIAYLTYISQGVDYEDYRDERTIQDISEPDLENGEQLYNEKLKDSAPVLWGEHSFTDGSNMSRMSVMTNYVKNHLPEDDPNSFSDQEAIDIAGFILSQDRPLWKEGNSDWSDGDKPTDFINKEEREAIQKGDFDWSVVTK